jgi:phage tail sheath gpL-like
MPSFNQVPANLRIPFMAVEFDPSNAQNGPIDLEYHLLIWGQKIAAGSGVANTRYLITTEDDAVTLAGRGSMLHRMVKASFRNNQFTKRSIVVLDDNGAGVAASGTITVTGPATASGTISLYMGGELVSVAVTSGDVQNTIATNINAAINAATDLPVTSTVATNVVTVTFRHKGEVGNSYNMRVNYQPSEKLPAGVALAFVQLANGTTNPTLTSAIAALGESPWTTVWANPYTDATSLTALENELASRFGPMRAISAVMFSSAVGTVSTLSTLGESRNSPHSVIMSQPGKTPPMPPMEHAAAVAAVVAFYSAIDQAQPLHTLPLEGILAPAEVDRFTDSERNGLLFDGIGTCTADTTGVVRLERPITTYKTNAAGSPDTAYLDSTTLFNLMYLRYSWRARIRTKYPRAKLADDSYKPKPGQQVITPKIGKAEAIGWAIQMEEKGLVQNVDQFKRDVQCTKVGPTRLEWLLPPTLMGQFIVGASQLQFRL